MAKRKKKRPITQAERDKQIEQRKLEILQDMYGIEEGEKRYREIQERIKEDSERSKKESWHEQEERKEQERVERWKKKYQGISLQELLIARDKFRDDLNRTRRISHYTRDREDSLKELEAKIAAVQYLIDNPVTIYPSQKGRDVESPSIEKSDTNDQYMFSDFKQSYIKYVKTGKAPKTLESVERAFKHFEAYFGDKPLNSFVPEDLELYKASRKGKVKDVTINIEIRTIKGAFQIAVDWNKLKDHPFKKVKQIKIPEMKTPSFTEEEFKMLCKKIKDDRFLHLVRFGILTGMRRGEIIGLKWNNVDRTNGFITVVSTEEHRVKYGKKRNLPIHPQVAEILEAVKNQSEYVFLNKKKKPYNDGTVSKKFKKYIRDAGLRNELHFHSLRATFITWLIKQGVPEGTVQQLVGHTDIKTTQGYTTYDDKTLTNAVGKINLPD